MQPMEGPRVHSRCLAFIPCKFWEEGPRGGWGEGFFSFFFGSQCVPQHNITMCSFSLPPIKTLRTPPPPPFHEKNKNHDPPKLLLSSSDAPQGTSSDWKNLQGTTQFLSRQTRPRKHIEYENHTLLTQIQNIPSQTD